ncbi:MAG: hypothetical protein HFG99_04135 [Dorea sp.]|jgi:hypothetical protein|nr:hypothetical protein [Dorea sp.]MCI9248329.1 hypothetical protein [Dorea sp.]
MMEADNSDITDEGAETMKGTGKKAASLILIVLICMMAVMPVQAFGNKKWTIGYEKNTNGPEKKAQGTNGWYFMYSTETDTDGKLNVSEVKECVWSDRGSCWMWYDYDEMWVPDIFAAEGYDCLNTKCWWRMDGNGIMDPNVTEGTVRSIIAWEAPEDGTYSVELAYTAGSLPFDWYGKDYAAGDGVTLSLCTDKGMLDSVFCGKAPRASSKKKKAADIPEGSLGRTVTLKEGERLYVSADPGADGGSDVADIQMKIVQEKGESIRSFMLTLMMVCIAAIIVLVTLGAILIIRSRIPREEEGMRDSEE